MKYNMKQEDRELLLKDLSARLPYNVIVHGVYANQNFDFDTESDYIEYKEFDNVLTLSDIEWIQMCAAEVKPYLFPMSNMTEEQYELLKKSGILSNCSHSYEYVTNIYGSSFIFKGFKTYSLELIEYLNKNHFDYRGLIEKGLANDATNRNIY